MGDGGGVWGKETRKEARVKVREWMGRKRAVETSQLNSVKAYQNSVVINDCGCTIGKLSVKHTKC